MRSDFAYDPVTAIDDSAAVGETALVFSEIRRTMDIPLVTSIWRGLAGMDNSLRLVWDAAKPIYESGEPERALARSITAANLPSPEPLAPTALACIGMTEGDVLTARAVIAAYNRSNGLNLMALAALIAPATRESGAALTVASEASPAQWPPLPPLLPREAIAADTWDIIRHVNAFGASDIDAGIATLWRHLAHWPALLALIHCAFAPLQSRSFIDQANAQLVALSEAEGVRMAYRRPTLPTLSPKALATITGYVRSPTQVVRMVVIGHVLAAWLVR
jgi:hypothetical protein